MEANIPPGGDEFVRLLQQTDLTTERSARREGEIPLDIPAAQDLLSKHLASPEKARIDDGMVPQGPTCIFRTIHLPPSYLPCTKPSHKLIAMLISEMRLETHHRGRKVMLRVLTQPYRINTVLLLVEDEAGNGTILQLHHILEESLMPCEEVASEGRVCILKEPYFKVAVDGSYSLRVDHVNDIMWLAEDDEQVPSKWRTKGLPKDISSLQHRTQGNEAVKATQYSTAIQIAHTTEEAQLGSLNRSFVNLKLGRFEDALSDASGQQGVSREKGLFREARALYELGKYEESLERLTAISKEFPHNTAIKSHVHLAEVRLREVRDGQFAFSKMYREAYKENRGVDCATFSKPVEVRSSEGRGKGLFTTRPVSAGDLLLCEKAFSYCRIGEDIVTGGRQGILLSHVGSRTAYVHGHASLVTRIVQKLQHNPVTSRPFMDMYHGNYDEAPAREVDGRPVVDMFLVASTVLNSSFGSPRTTSEGFTRMVMEYTEERVQDSSICGVWVLAARINHSCIGNCNRSFFGDMQIICATCDLPEGAELLFPYIEHWPLSTYEETQRELEKCGFHCDCAICADKKNTSRAVMSRRKELTSKFKQYMIPAPEWKPTDLDGAKAMLDELQASHNNPVRVPRTVSGTSGNEPTFTPHLALMGPYLVFGGMLLNLGYRKESFAATLKGLEAAGFDIVAPPIPETTFDKPPGDLSIKSWGMIDIGVVLSFWHLHQVYNKVLTKPGRTAKKYLITSYKIMVGESESVLSAFPALA